MDNLTNYYKDLCEELQYKINILEAKMKKAMQSGSPELIRKELLKKKVKQQDLRQQADAAGKASFEALKSGKQAVAGSMGMWQMAAQDREIAQEQDIKNLIAKKKLSGEMEEAEKLEVSNIAKTSRARRDVASTAQKKEIQATKERRKNILGIPSMSSLYGVVGSSQY